MIYLDKMNSPIGILTVKADENKLLNIYFGNFCSEKKPNGITDAAIEQLTEYFEGSREEFDIPVFLKGTDFQLKVWKELMNIPYGTVCTYKDIANRIGNFNGARAVGGANNKNPIPIIIPCHRVVASDGIGGYASGITIKTILLDIEKKNIERQLK